MDIFIACDLGSSEKIIVQKKLKEHNLFFSNNHQVFQHCKYVFIHTEINDRGNKCYIILGIQIFYHDLLCQLLCLLTLNIHVFYKKLFFLNFKNGGNHTFSLGQRTFEERARKRTFKNKN